MELGNIINFKNLYSQEKPDITKLLEGFERSDLLAILFSINTELYINFEDNFDNVDKGLITHFLSAVEENGKYDFLLRYAGFVKERSTTKCIIFNQKVTLKFIQFVLLNIDIKQTRQYNARIDDLNFVKAYLSFNQMEEEELSEYLNIPEIVELDHINFYKWHWPLLIQQYEYFTRKNPILQLIFGTVSLFSLIEKPEYQIFVRDFLQSNDSKNFFEYTHFVINHIVNLSNKELNYFNRFFLKVTDDFSGRYFYDLITIEERELLENDELQISFKGLKSKPLFKLNEFTYGVIDWNFFAKKAFDSLFFDLFNKTSIKDEFNNNFPNFKSQIIGKLIEKEIFSPLIYFIFNNKQRVLNSDYSDKQSKNISYPDYYVRIRNRIYLFEFKSSSFKGAVKDAPTYNDIKDEIDSKINQYKGPSNTKKVGSGQLFDQIKNLSIKPFEFDDFVELGIKYKNLKIYPILVVEDESFAIPGVNHYINTEFKTKMEELSSITFKVENITIMSLEFIFSNILSLRDNAKDLFNLLENYHQLIEHNTGRLNKKILPNTKEYHKIYQNFESYYSSKFPLKGKNPRFISALFEIYNIQKIANKYLPNN